jgi:activating signal cointegrator complex subunit 1
LNPVFYGFIIGKGGATRQQIEAETQTRVVLPRRGDGNDIVEVSGYSHEDVVACRRKIDSIVMGSRNKMDFTHFVSIPFNTEEIMGNFQKFIDEISGDASIVLNPKAFQNPQKLHQTVLLVILIDNEEKIQAIKCLTDCQEAVIKPFFQNRDKLTLKLQGVEIMNDDPSQVNVLYAKIDSPELQELCNQMLEFFRKNGLITRQEKDQVKLHVTLINTRYVNENENGQLDRRAPKVFFDASKIIESYKDYYFGSIELKEIHLSQRHTQAENGFYVASAIINF